MRQTFLFILFFLHQICFGKTIVVPPNGSIQKAIHAAQPFDTVLVENGYFIENQIVVNTPLSILGKNFPIIDAQFQNEIFTITANDVLIQGFHLMNIGKTAMIDWAAVKVLESERVRIVGNHVEQGYFGIYLSASKNCWVEGNRITGNPSVEQNTGNGIHAWKCDSLTIVNNYAEGHRDGIYFEFVTNTFIANNLCTRNIRYGLHFMFSHENTYQDNTFRNNGAGVAVMYTKKVVMQRNHFEQNWGAAAYGLLLKDISDSRIENNSFTNNTSGIFMEGASRNQFKDNLFSENGYAVRVQASCDDNVFEQNSFLKNTFDIATNGSTMLNQFKHNYWDKYEGYDLNRDGLGDVPYNPVSLFSRIIEDLPVAVMLYRSFLSMLLDRSEKALPSLIPDNLLDNSPTMKPI
jgi:nitrous oxidase accessory protein